MSMIEQFRDKAYVHNGRMLLFNAVTAIDIVNKCKECGVAILNIEAFTRHGVCIQPHTSDSIDFPHNLMSAAQKREHWNVAENFLKHKIDSNLYFELFLEDE
jgi:hypothetical protein